jgi:hypothetical protein
VGHIRSDDMESSRVTTEVLENGTNRVLEFIVVTIGVCELVEQGAEGCMKFSPIQPGVGDTDGILSGPRVQEICGIQQGLLKEDV